MGQSMKVQAPENFIVELHALLKRHGASIYWTCDSCSDTHGIYGEKMVIDIKGTDIFSTKHGYIDAQMIESETK